MQRERERERERETAGAAQNVQPAPLPEQRAENAPAHEQNSSNASANGFTTQDVYGLIAGVNATPCPLDFLIYSQKTLVFNIDENTPDVNLISYFYNIEDVKKDFDIAVEHMYGVHVKSYNSYLNDLLGEARVQKYLIPDDRLKTSFQAFYGTVEPYKYDIITACEQMRQYFINLENTVKDKDSRSDAKFKHNMLMGGAAVVAGFLTGGIALPLMAGAGLLAKNSNDNAALEHYDRQIENINRTINDLKQKIKKSTDAVLEIVKKEQLNLINGPLLSALSDVLNAEIASGSISVEELKKSLSAAIQKEERDCRTATAHMYLLGISVPQDLQQAYHLYLNSAEQNNGEALAALGFMHQSGMYVAENPEKAFAYFKKAAELGNADGIEALGDCYVKGYGTEKNTNKGFNLYLKASEMGIKSAQAAAAHCYLKGIGIEKSYDKAYELFKPAAEEREEEAQYWLGYMYDNGLSVDVNKQEALKWYHRAIVSGNFDAMVQLGMMYQYGDGVEQDKSLAMRYYEYTAEQGHPRGQASLGWICLQDDDFKDKDRAFTLLQQSAETGDDLGQLFYGFALANEKQDYNSAFKWYSLSAEQGNAVAMNNLAVCYEFGQGVGVNKSEAKRLYKMAVDNGFANAQKGYNRC